MSVVQWRKKFIHKPDMEYQRLLNEFPVDTARNDWVLQADAIKLQSEQVAHLLEKKGQLSRNIGLMKRQGEDCAGLIREVSECVSGITEKSKKIDELLISVSSHLADSSSNEAAREARSDKAEQSDEFDKAELSDKADKSDISDISDISDKSDKSVESEKSDDLNITAYSDNSPGYFVGEPTNHRGKKTSSKNALRVKIEKNAEAWDKYVDIHPAKTGYHKFAWGNIFTDVFGHENHYLSAIDESENICGVLPLVHVTSQLFPPQLVSLPFVNYGGILADDVHIQRTLAAHAAKIAEELGCDHLELRETSTLADWPNRSHKISLWMSLPSTDEAFDSSLSSKLRSQCRRATKAGAVGLAGGQSLLGDFYSVFSRKMRDHGTPVLPIQFFEEIMNEFPEESFVVVSYLDGKPCASAFLIGHGNTLEVPWAGSVQKYNKISINMHLYRRVFREGILRRYSYFDFGRSTPNSSTHQFKKQWGAKPEQLFWNYWLAPSKCVPTSAEDSLKFRILIGTWKRTPLFLTNRIGPHVISGIP